MKGKGVLVARPVPDPEDQKSLALAPLTRIHLSLALTTRSSLRIDIQICESTSSNARENRIGTLARWLKETLPQYHQSRSPNFLCSRRLPHGDRDEKKINIATAQAWTGTPGISFP